MLCICIALFLIDLCVVIILISSLEVFTFSLPFRFVNVLPYLFYSLLFALISYYCFWIFINHFPLFDCLSYVKWMQ